ncbi:MAG TPA: RagB/SusD family nutrient uptake outer membrane protein [Bacteroidales bacterium]|jgi:hypothetical protein|nr:RagB/SusD family nutrient uptake outer membrane protein [Bacteroidales bacterium]HQH23307.1 RagB/SusD family nutrient uptake outer membrane protein [Bacteroidales bacterium]HQJ82211.1 RagB/SusD family nutrient uptake outer membrane protein [Bacteroidales bacterium]
MSIKHLLIAITTVFIFVSCNESWLSEKPPHLITTETLYTNLAGFETGLNGLYGMVRMEREGRTGANDLIADMFMNGVDNLVTNHRDVGFSMICERWGDLNNPENAHYIGVFEWLYSIINAANTIINQAEKKDNIDWSGGGFPAEENKNRVIAEAKAIRGWAYRHLTYCWGDVPLSLEESLGSTIKTNWTRTPTADVRKQIISDFLFAEKYIPVEGSLQGRITKGAVQHYLSEMYLVKNNPDSSLYWADQVINNPAYQLITSRYGVKSNQPGVPFMDMFYEGNENRNQGNTEALWVFQFAIFTNGGGKCLMRRHHGSRYAEINISGVRPLQDTYERGGRGRSRMSFSKWALELYEPQDDRGSHYAIRKFFILNNAEDNAPYPADRLPPGYQYGDTIWLDWSNDITYETRARLNWPFSNKTNGTDPSNVSDSYQYNDQIYLRLADTYLLKAEAQFKLGLSEEAANTINIIRRRSNASDITAGDVNIDFILDERSRELILEEHRRYTLIRTHKLLERTRAYNNNGGGLISERDTIFPIPQPVIDANISQSMPQNPGWN